MAKPPVIIYKTTKDYNLNIPVIMNREKTQIISYPGIQDIYYAGKLAVPTALANGFLLDNRGIGPDVAFLSYTYKEYAELEETPTAEQLMERIIDRDPLEQMYRCECERDSALISEMLKQGQMASFILLR